MVGEKHRYLSSEVSLRQPFGFGAVQQLISYIGRYCRDLDVVGPAEMFPPAGSFEGPRDRCSIRDRLELSPEQPLGRSPRPGPIAMIPEGPPIANMPVDDLGTSTQPAAGGNAATSA